MSNPSPTPKATASPKAVRLQIRPVERISSLKMFIKSIPAAGVSIFIHIMLLVGLAFLITDGGKRIQKVVNINTELKEREVHEFNQLTDPVTEPTTNLTVTTPSSAASSGTGGGSGGSGGLTGGAGPKVDQSLIPTAVPSVTVGLGEMPGKGNLDLNINVKGEELVVVNDHQAVIDRLTRELLRMLKERKVLVVWMFDESLSMKDEQEDIAKRFDKIYDELKLSGAAKGDALMTSVLSYGKEMHVHTDEPTSDVEVIRSAIADIPIDKSGEEWPCKYVIEAAKEYGTYFSRGKRQVCLVIVTDESGERATAERKEMDGVFVEDSVGKANDIKMPIYVVGRQSVFGYPYARLLYVDPETGDRYYPQITRGPESAGLECLQTEGLHTRWDEQSSGFGPYELVRLARDSGGIYFMLPTPDLYVKETRYDPLDMKEYVPEYGLRRDYVSNRDASDFRRAIFQVIQESKGIRVALNFSIDPSVMLTQANNAYGLARKNREILTLCYQYLETVRSQRDYEESRRWRAHYDLLVGQIFAYQVKLYEYEYFLQSFASAPRVPKTKPDPTGEYTLSWRINHAHHKDKQLFTCEKSHTDGLGRRVSKEFRGEFAKHDIELSNQLVISILEKNKEWQIYEPVSSTAYLVRLDGDHLTVIQKGTWAPHADIDEPMKHAVAMLTKVIDEHPGTPWAARAKYELSRGFSVGFHEWRRSKRYAERAKLVPKY